MAHPPSLPLRFAHRIREHWLAVAYGRTGMRRRVNGVRLRVYPQYRWYFTPDHDAVAAAYLRSRTRPGDTCLSLGANLGLYPLQMAVWSGGAGRVIACEPSPQAAEVLRNHVRMNGLEPRVQVLEVAVSSESGRARFNASGVDGMNRLGAVNPLVTTPVEEVDVSVVTPDELCHRHGLHPDIVMMDIEGFEIAALQGSRVMLANAPPRAVVVEMHPDAWANAATRREDLERILAENRLRAVSLTGQSDPLGEYGHVALERDC